MLKTDHMRQIRPDPEAALAIGIQALEFLAADPVQLHRFLDLSGLDVRQLRAAAGNPAFFAGLLDFLLGHEPTLLAFATQAELSPDAIGAARETLSHAFSTAPR